MQMTFNKFLAAASLIALLPLQAQSAPYVTGSYGQLIGTWDLGDPSTVPNNPTDTPASVLEWGLNVLAVTNPDPFLIADWHLAGTSDGEWLSASTGALDFTFVDANTGSWEYLGGANDGNPVDLYIAVKYSQYVSMFFFGDNVVAGDTGLFTSNQLEYYTAKGMSVPDGCSNFAFSDTDNFSSTCFGQNNANGHDISHVVGYWPPGDIVDQEVPAPGALALLGLGLLGLGLGFRRRRA